MYSEQDIRQPMNEAKELPKLTPSEFRAYIGCSDTMNQFVSLKTTKTDLSLSFRCFIAILHTRDLVYLLRVSITLLTSRATILPNMGLDGEQRRGEIFFWHLFFESLFPII